MHSGPAGSNHAFYQGERPPYGPSFLAGMLVCIISAYIAGAIEVLSGVGPEDTSIFLSPMIEEFMKLLTILFCIFMFESSGDKTDLFAVGIGAGFATFENCCFILSSGAPQLTNVLIRGAAVGVMHIVTLVAVAKGIRFLKRYNIFSFAGIAGVFSLLVTVHGLYNLLVSKPGVSSYIGYVMPMACAILLYMFTSGRNRYNERSSTKQSNGGILWQKK